jgi:hypothetical protein
MCRYSAYGVIRGALQSPERDCRKFQQVRGRKDTLAGFALAFAFWIPIRWAPRLYSEDMLRRRLTRTRELL